LLFFTGKGGTGKSTMAAATALLAATHGRRVLLVDVDSKGSSAQLLEHANVGYSPVEVQPGVRAMAMDTEKSLREYLKLHLRVPVVGRVGPVAHAFEFVATAAPGVKEILTIGKIAWEAREAIEGRADHDMVVVDAAASGHVVAQLAAPQTIRDLADVGPLRSQTDWMIELLSDAAITSVNIVTTPEEMPVAETIELVDRIRADTHVHLGAVVVNRVLPELFTHRDEATFEALRSAPVVAELAADVGAGVEQVLDGARLAVELRRARAEHLDRLRDTVALPLLYVPYQFGGQQGIRVTRRIADDLGSELGL
jgi:anion-transporting  ArsA/GET3 family ATPase